jgi:hypothetical protein
MNQVATTENKTVAAYAPQQTNFDEIVTKDLQIPRILLSQAMSDRVKAKKCQSGDFVLSAGDRILAKEGEELKLIPIKQRAVWVNYDMTTKRGEFKGVEPRTNQNADLPWTYTGKDLRTGKEYPAKRVQAIEVFGMLPEQLLEFAKTVKAAEESGEIPDLSLIPTPVGMSLQSMAFKFAGKPLAQFFDQVKSAQIHFKNVRPFSYVLTFKAVEEASEDGSYFVPKLTDQQQVVKAYGKEEAQIIFENCDALLAKINAANIIMDSDEETPTSGASDIVSDLV